MDPSYEKIQYKIKTLVENTNDTTDEVLINSTVLYVQVLLQQCGRHNGLMVKMFNSRKEVQV